MKPRSIHRPITVSCENIDCSEPQSLSFTPTEFEDYLEEGEFACGSCGEEMSAEGVRIECYICDAEFDDYNLSQLPSLLEERCNNCAGREEWDADFYSIRIAGSWSSEYDIYDWTANGKQISSLEREGRTDYWEGLVHFCSAEEFISIYRERRIRAASTGLYGKRNPNKTKAVCLTEATMPNWDELKKAHGNYGFVFRKRDVIGLQGTPAIYLPQSVIDSMKAKGESLPETLWPYLTKLKLPTEESAGKHDYLHEREWRVPQDISFDDVAPYAVTFSKRRPGIEDEELILQAAREFQELSKSGLPPEDDETK
jgi:hypothetical protein